MDVIPVQVCVVMYVYMCLYVCVSVRLYVYWMGNAYEVCVRACYVCM